MSPLVVLAGSAHPALAEAVRGALGLGEPPGGVTRFPDGEVFARVDERLVGADVYVLQPTVAPAGEHLMEMLLLADACRRAAVARVTAVLPYFGYSRQDRRTHAGDAVGGRVVAEILDLGRFTRVLALDPHTRALEGFLSTPLDPLSAVPALIATLRPHVGPDGVIVAPDVGAAKLARQFGEALGLPVVVVHKTRVSGSQVSADDVVGDVVGRRPILVDDMVSTGGTIAAAAHALRARGAVGDPIVVASHALLVGGAVERLAGASIARLVTSDAIPPVTGLPFPLEIASVAPVIAEAIRRLNAGRPLGDVLAAR